MYTTRPAKNLHEKKGAILGDTSEYLLKHYCSLKMGCRKYQNICFERKICCSMVTNCVFLIVRSLRIKNEIITLTSPLLGLLTFLIGTTVRHTCGRHIKPHGD